jgi:large subunit ribosomal protein L29
MSKAQELREMAEEQIRLVWKDAAESLFRLRIQSQTEKIAAPSEVRKHRRTIARCQTVLNERGLLAPSAAAEQTAGAVAAQGKQPRKRGPGGRPQAKAPGKGGAKHRIEKRTQGNAEGGA